VSFAVRPFDGSLDTGAFCCGQAALDDYIRRYAGQDERRGVARVFVATPVDDHRRLAGFFTLSAATVRCADLPPELARKLPRYPIPVALLGRLAVDCAFQGKGLGSILVADACRKVLAASRALAVAGLVVDAKDAAAVAFYRHFGFLSLPGRVDRLLLPLRVLSEIAAEPQSG
jgi:ribosomal protein S18 acetylase RimI-like enzyme